MALPILVVRPSADSSAGNSETSAVLSSAQAHAVLARLDGGAFAPKIVMTEATQEQSAASAAILAVPTRPADGRGVGTPAGGAADSAAEVPTQPATGDTLALDAAASTESPITLTVAPETDAATQAKPAPSRQKLYVVRKGDSLARIARREGVSVSALAKANGLKARSRIRAGVRLRIPSAGMKANRELASAADAVDGSNLGDSALRYRGVPYRYAGMSSRGMDCSGLVARVLQAHGIRAPHNARALFQLGKSVSRGDLKADDLVFFSTRGGGISHVGIYLGGGKFVHASSGGGRVQVDSLDSGYYAKRLVGARRLG
jgi:cell wall-associated NlpC family hydrolase